MRNLAEVFTKTDWALLAEQKLALLRAIEKRRIEGKEQEHLDGILNWIDAIQDATTADGYPVPWVEVAEDDIEHCGRITNA